MNVSSFMREIYPEDMVKVAKNGFYNSSNCEAYERVFLTTVAIQGIQHLLENEENKANEYAYCLRMYFATKRDPLLTINEVRIVLYVCFFIVEKLYLFEPFCDGFVKLMPECSTQLEPRNLTDLARCQIRKNLKERNLPLPLAVEKLNLPPLLKSFVLGTVVDLSSKRGNVSPDKIIPISQLEEVTVEKWCELLDPHYPNLKFFTPSV